MAFNNLSFQPRTENIYMFKHAFLALSISSFLISVTFAEKAQDNIQPHVSKENNIATVTSEKEKLPEKYPTPDEIDKLMRIHFPKEWAQKQSAQNKPETPKPTTKETVKTPTKAPAKVEPKASTTAPVQSAQAKDTIRVRQIIAGKTAQQKLNEHKATEVQKLAINIKYSYNPKLYTLLPDNVKDIGLIGRVNYTSVGSLRIYRDVSSKAFADAYFQNHQRHSELFSAYLARKITLNDGVIGEKVTLYKAFIDELGYKFADTPVRSVRSAKEAEEKYLYIMLRLTPSDRIHFWKYINTMRTGDTVNLPVGLTIADILTAVL